jgi:hypothetical protein
MKTVRKFKTFEDLKSCENKPAKYILRLKKHINFEKTILSLQKLSQN